MIDVGCRKRELVTVPGPNGDRLESIFSGAGRLLAKEACIDDSYTKTVVPEIGITKIYTKITKQTVRSVDSKKGTVSVEFLISMAWMDPRIKTKFTAQNRENGYVLLSNEAINDIWTADLSIQNRRSFHSMDHWASLKRAKILIGKTTITDDGQRKNHTTPLIEIRYQIKSTVYCEFEHSAYPMDHQICKVSMGSSSHGAIFVMRWHRCANKRPVIHLSTDFNISMSLFDENTGQGDNEIGIKIKMDRKLSPFMLQYYIPCIAIIMVSQLSFVIPVNALPGRVALLVTLFLTLVNLFIHQMVSTP